MNLKAILNFLRLSDTEHEAYHDFRGRFGRPIRFTEFDDLIAVSRKLNELAESKGFQTMLP